MLRSVAAAAALALSMTAAAVTPASAVVSWASWTGPVNNENDCITRARAAAAALPSLLNVTYNTDYQADTALELEITAHNGASTRVVALFLCQNEVGVIIAFGEPFDTAQALRDVLRDHFLGRTPSTPNGGGGGGGGGGKPR